MNTIKKIEIGIIRRFIGFVSDMARAAIANTNENKLKKKQNAGNIVCCVEQASRSGWTSVNAIRTFESSSTSARIINPVAKFAVCLFVGFFGIRL